MRAQNRMLNGYQSDKPAAHDAVVREPVNVKALRSASKLALSSAWRRTSASALVVSAIDCSPSSTSSLVHEVSVSALQSCVPIAASSMMS